MIHQSKIQLSDDSKPVKRALISVFDKTGITELAQTLSEHNIELISTGGTSKKLKEAGFEVTDVDSITGFPECFDGRVKTLHPLIHGGLLARRSLEQDQKDMQRLGIKGIDLLIVNLYPFEEAIATEGTSITDAYENIDIGGPAMLRAAAKNVNDVGVITDPSDYSELKNELNDNKGSVSASFRRRMSAKTFSLTASYDAAIANYLTQEDDQPESFHVGYPLHQSLRYGENPHQNAGMYGRPDEHFECFHGKALSYNNYLDIDAALNFIAEFDTTETVCGIFKHTVPCGAAKADALSEAWKLAFATDTVSPFGGIVVVNQTLDKETAGLIDEIFTELILAPDYSDEARALLEQKANRRLIRYDQNVFSHGHQPRWSYRNCVGGALVQETDLKMIEQKELKFATAQQPDDSQLEDLLFAWKVAKHVKSNAIVFAKNGQTLGIGGGQPSRVDASEIAVSKAKKAGLSLEGSAIASDAFFPFADGVEAAAEAGASAVIQPGGSVRDDEVLEAAEKHNMCMVLTGMRHFRH